MENIHKLFTKFFQVDSTARRKQGGTGLGLAISKGIVQGHNGKMWAESEGLGKGTTFFFTVPYIPTGEKEKIEKTQKTEKIKKEASKGNKEGKAKHKKPKQKKSKRKK